MIDVHGHIWMHEREISKRDVLSLCKKFGIKKVFISSLYEDIFNPDENEISNANNTTFSFIKESGGLAEGMAYINPRNANCAAEAKSCLENGMKGIKLWVSAFCDDTPVNPVAELAINYKVPLLVHAFYKSTGQLENESRGSHVRQLALRYPALKIIMAHLGANVYDAVKCVSGCANVYADISGSIFRRDDLDYAIKHMSAERLLFGTDMPGSFENCFGQVEGADIGDEDKQKIYYGNAIKLFNLKG